MKMAVKEVCGLGHCPKVCETEALLAMEISLLISKKATHTSKAFPSLFAKEENKSHGDF